MKNLKLTVLCIVVTVFGGVMLSIGIDKIFFGEKINKLNSDLEEAKKTVRVYNVGDPLVFNLTPAFDSLNNIPAQSILLTLEKDIIFDRDIIKIKAEAIDVKNNVLEISLIINNNKLDLAGKTLDEINFERKYASDHNLLLSLNSQTNPPFTDEISPKFSKPNVNYYVSGAVLLDNGVIESIRNTNELFTVYSKINKLQVDTNKAILEQTDKTEINNIQQDITNELFLGLAIIGVAVIPIMSGFDFLFRIHFDKN